MFDKIADYKIFSRFYNLIEMLKVHGEMEYGTDEIDIKALVDFLQSNQANVRFFSCSDERVAECITEDFLDGMPVWTFFKLSPWTQKMLQKEHEEYCREAEERYQKEYNAALKKYKCLQQCQYYKCGVTSFGTYVACEYSGDWRHPKSRMCGDDFEYKQKCPHYEKDSTKEKDPIYVGQKG